MRLATIAAAIAITAASHAAAAAPILWTLTGVTFSDGGTASGSFVYGASITGYSDVSITVTPFAAAGLPSFTYGSRSISLNASPTGVDFLDPVTNRFLRLSFASALTGAGGVVALNPSSLEGDQNGDTRLIIGGSVAGSAVPEPAGWTMMLVGFGTAGYALRRRRAARARPAALRGA